MIIDLLISTVNHDIPEILKNGKNIPEGCNAIVIDQANNRLGKRKNRFIEFNEIGISKSRNRALELAKSDICLICDNDIDLVTDFDKILKKAFKNYPKADFLTFKINTPNGDGYKNYKNNAYQHNLKSILNVSSIEIAFRREPFINREIRFDERFGIGSKYKSGEEVIFLRDAICKGLKGWYIPEVITIHKNKSSGKNYSCPGVFRDKGALFVRLFGLFGILESIKMVIKRRHKYDYSIFYGMIQGIKGGLDFYIHEKNMFTKSITKPSS